MLPSSLTGAERARQCVLRRKIKGVMQILQGNTPDKTVDLDPTFVWDACWTRCVAAFEIREPCSWAVTTFFDFLMKKPARVEAARNAHAISFAEASLAAATSAAKAAQAAALFGQAAAAFAPIRIVNVPPQAAAAVAVTAAPSLESFAADVAQAAAAVAVTAAPYLEYVAADVAQAAAAVAVTAAPSLESVAAGAPSASSPDWEYGDKNGVRCTVCDHVYYDRTGYRKHLLKRVACDEGRSFRRVIRREAVVERDVDEQPFAAEVAGSDTNANPAPTQEYSSVAAGFELQAARAAPSPSSDDEPVIGASSRQIIEYGTKKGVRCLICTRVYADKSGYNKHLKLFDNCERAQSFRHVHVQKRSAHIDEEAALASAQAFRNVRSRNV
jgi:hypothetical protein